jgi:S-DNA-T family DNA segregation ATPase FtsK/SpoIIIE
LDLLQQVVAPALASVSLDALPVGIQEDGEPYRLQLLGTHLLLVGATGAGKSSVHRHRSRIGCATASNPKLDD